MPKLCCVSRCTLPCWKNAKNKWEFFNEACLFCNCNVEIWRYHSRFNLDIGSRLGTGKWSLELPMLMSVPLQQTASLCERVYLSLSWATPVLTGIL